MSQASSSLGFAKTYQRTRSPFVHDHHRAVPVKIAVDGVNAIEVLDVNVAAIVIFRVAIESFKAGVPIPTEVFIIEPELDDKFSAHVFR